MDMPMKMVLAAIMALGIAFPALPAPVSPPASRAAVEKSVQISPLLTMLLPQSNALPDITAAAQVSSPLPPSAPLYRRHCVLLI